MEQNELRINLDDEDEESEDERNRREYEEELESLEEDQSFEEEEQESLELSDNGPTLEEIRSAKPGIIIERDGDNLIRNFNSWDEFITCVADESLNSWGPKYQYSHKKSTNDDRYFASESFESAIRMATVTGWPEGRKLMSEALVAVRPKLETYKSIEFSVAGAFPMVPNYCAGDPECMVIDPGADQRNAKPVVRIDYNNCVNAHVDAKAMMLRGAAVVSLAESLERRGISTELRLVGNAGAPWGSRTKLVIRYNIVYKRAGEPLDIDRAAFALAHPAVLRRFILALEEQSPELFDWHDSYGHALSEPNDPTSGKPNGAIYISGPGYRETPETARKAVEDAAAAVLQLEGTGK